MDTNLLQAYFNNNLIKLKPLVWFQSPKPPYPCFASTVIGKIFIEKVKDDTSSYGFSYSPIIYKTDNLKYTKFEEAQAVVADYVEKTLLNAFEISRPEINLPPIVDGKKIVSLSATRIFELMGDLSREITILIEDYKDKKEIYNIQKIETILEEINALPYEASVGDIGLKLEGVFRQVFGYETFKRDIPAVLDIINEAELWKYNDSESYNLAASKMAYQLTPLESTEREISKISSLWEISKKFAENQQDRADNLESKMKEVLKQISELESKNATK